MMNGEQSAMMDGVPLMLKWPADNLDMTLEVHMMISQTNSYNCIP